MLYQLKNLSESEQNQVLNAPVWVTLLIACADHDIDERELDRAKEIVHIKSFAEKSEIKELYKELDTQMDDAIDNALKDLITNGDARLDYIKDNLSKLNEILPKMDQTYAAKLYDSLKQLALYVAQSDGGFLGINRISEEESELIDLPMINQP